MAMYRKLGKATKPRRALLRNQVTALLYNGKIVTTEARAKEIKKIVEPMITLAAKEKDNYETLTVDCKVPEKDKDGKRVKEVVDGKKVTKYTTVKKEIKKLIDEIIILILLEQLNDYIRLLNQIMECIRLFSIGKTITGIDEVNYADIIPEAKGPKTG